jgi:hypothetical protein
VAEKFNRVVHALPSLSWTALPDKNIDFLNQHLGDYTALDIEEARATDTGVLHPEEQSGPPECWRSGLIFGEAGLPQAAERTMGNGSLGAIQASTSAGCQRVMRNA